MPNRIIKESINESKTLNELSGFAQDLFKRLITYADDYGRFNADVEIMRARLYPRELEAVEVDDINYALIELAGIKKVVFYRNKTRSDDIYGYLPGWEKHQRIRNTKAKCPDPETEDVNDWYLKRFIPLALKIKIFERDNFTCKNCGKSFKIDGINTQKAVRLLNGVLHIDHIIPVCQGGRATEENLQLLCATCNLKKKRRYSIEEIIKETLSNISVADCGKLPQVAADCGLNPIQSESESESNTNTNTSARKSSQPGKVQFAENVSMTNAEYEKLVSTYGEADTTRMIEKLDNYKGATGKKYKSDYRAILNWVADEITKQKNKDNHEPKSWNTLRHLYKKYDAEEKLERSGYP